MKIDTAQLHREIQARTHKVWADLCEINPRLCRFDPPIVNLNGRLYRTAGWCYQATRRIELGIKFFEAGFYARMMHVTLPHEIIHQADFDLYGPSNKKCGHGTGWVKLMVEYGLEPEPFHTMFLTRKGERV